MGDRVYNSCVLEVFEKWQLPRSCIVVLFPVLTSNAYQKKIVQQYPITKFCINKYVKSPEAVLPGKYPATALEVLLRSLFLFHIFLSCLC